MKMEATLQPLLVFKKPETDNVQPKIDLTLTPTPAPTPTPTPTPTLTLTLTLTLTRCSQRSKRGWPR